MDETAQDVWVGGTLTKSSLFRWSLQSKLPTTPERTILLQVDNENGWVRGSDTLSLGTVALRRQWMVGLKEAALSLRTAAMGGWVEGRGDSL